MKRTLCILGGNGPELRTPLPTGRAQAPKRGMRPRRLASPPIRLWCLYTLLQWASSTTGFFALVAEPKPDLGEGSSCALRTAEQKARDKVFGGHPLPVSFGSCWWSTWLKTLRGGSLWHSPPRWMSHQRRQQQKKPQTAQPASSSMTTPKEDSGYLDLRDSYAPIFTGQPADYREWRLVDSCRLWRWPINKPPCQLVLRPHRQPAVQHPGSARGRAKVESPRARTRATPSATLHPPEAKVILRVAHVPT